MELKNVKFGIELEMYGYYTDEQFINTVHRECEKRLLPVTIIDGNENEDAMPDTEWLLKGDSSIHVPKKGIATQVQQVGYRKGEQMFLPFGKMKHIEPETGVYDTTKPTHKEVKGMIDQELSQKDLFDKVQESRIITNPDILAGDEKIKAYKVSRDTIDNQENQYNDFELVSPPLKFVDSNIRLVGELADVLKRMRMKVNPSTGLHVHVSFPEINLFTFIKIMSFVDEHKIKNLWPTRFNKTYAKSKEEMKKEVEQYLEKMSDKAEKGDLNYAKINRLMPLVSEIGDRYFGVNIQSFEHHGTIEFRYAAGSLTSSEITDWLGYIRDLIDYCLKIKAVHNFLGRFDIKEERDGDIQIYDSRTRVTIKSDNLIDLFAHQKKDATTFLKEHNINNKDEVLKIIYAYLNKVGLMERKNVGNIFNNLIKFCNAIISENAFGLSAEVFASDFFDIYADPTSAFKEKDEEKEKDDDNWWDDNANNRPMDMHEDTFAHILEQTALRKIGSSGIANFIKSKVNDALGTESFHAKELIRSIVMNSDKNVIDKITKKELSLVLKSIQESDAYYDDTLPLYNFFKKIGSEKTKEILHKGKELDFRGVFSKFRYSIKTISNVIDFKSSKNFFISEFKEFLKDDDARGNYDMFNNIVFYSDAIGADTMIQIIRESEEKFSEQTAILLYNEMMRDNKNASSSLKEFVTKYVDNIAKNNNAKAFIQFINKHLHDEKITAFDLYEALNSVRDKRNGRINFSYISQSVNNPYSPALFNGKNFINKEERDLIGITKTDIYGNEDIYYSEQAKQYTIDLFKLLFKKFSEHKPQYLYAFTISGVDDFIKPEYLNNITESDIGHITRKYARLKYPLLADRHKSVPSLFKMITEKSDVMKYRFLMIMFSQIGGNNANKISKLIKEVIDNIDTLKLAKTLKDDNGLQIDIKIAIYNELMKNTDMQEIGLDKQLFEKEMRGAFSKLSSESKDEFNVLISFLNDNYDKQENVYNDKVKNIFDGMSEKDKLIVSFINEKNNKFDDPTRKQFLDYVKNDDEFFKKVVFAYSLISSGFFYVRGKTIKDSSFFIDICFAMGKKLDDANTKSMSSVPSFLHFDNSMRANINYNKLSMLNDKIVEYFMITNMGSITTDYPQRGMFWSANTKLLTDIYDKIIANKNLYKKMLNSKNDIIINHLDMMFYYRKMKKMNLKISSQADDKGGVMTTEFKINDKKYKINVDVKYQADGISHDISFTVDGKPIKSENIKIDKNSSTSGENALQIYINNVILNKPLNKVFEKYMKASPSGTHIKDKLKTIISLGVKNVYLRNKQFEFKAPPKKKKLNENVIVEKIDYHKEFKSIMVKKGVSEAKKFLTENKNNIEDRKLVAVMKQFGIR